MVPCLLIGTHSRDLISAAERADLELLLSVDTAEEDLYEQLATEFPEQDGDAALRHRSRPRLLPDFLEGHRARIAGV
jgi:hypothetical protein